MTKTLLSLLLMILATTGCTDKTEIANDMMSAIQSPEEIYTSNAIVMSENKEQKNELTLSINEIPLTVKWEDNESVSALIQLIEQDPLTINMEHYGGFEQVGNLPQNIDSSDKQMVAEPGDIVLYSGNAIVIFYESNTWTYTKLGHIEGLSTEELENILNSEQIAATLYVSKNE